MLLEETNELVDSVAQERNIILHKSLLMVSFSLKELGHSNSRTEAQPPTPRLTGHSGIYHEQRAFQNWPGSAGSFGTQTLSFSDDFQHV